LLAPYVSIQDTLVATASPARTALKNSQLTCGETHAYFGDRPLACIDHEPRETDHIICRICEMRRAVRA
jgi:hypothetical protein